MSDPHLQAQFNKLVGLLSKDMQKNGEEHNEFRNFFQQVAQKVTALEQRIRQLESGVKVVNGNSAVTPVGQTPTGEPVVDGTQTFYGDPNAFLKGDDDA